MKIINVLVRLVIVAIFLPIFTNYRRTISFYKCTVKCNAIQLMKYVAVSYNDILNIQWRIQEFQNRGSVSGVVEFWGSWDCFDVPSNLSYHFVLSTNKTYVKHWMLTTIKVYVCYAVKCYKIKPLNNFNWGGVRLVRRPWIRLWYLIKTVWNYHCIKERKDPPPPKKKQ